MVAHTTTASKRSGMYFYYACRTPYVKGRGSCPGAKHLSADNLEVKVWEAVSGLLKDPERLRAGLDAMLEQERAAWRGNPDKETELWAGKLAEAERMIRGYQEQAAKGYMTLEELGVALEELEKTRQTAERELTTLRSRKEHLDELERDRDALLESYARMVPEDTPLYQKNQALYGVFLTRERARLDELTRLIERGQVRPLVEEVLDLREVGRAHERLDSGHGRGKVVLRVAEV